MQGVLTPVDDTEQELLAHLFFFKQKTAYDIVSRDWSSDVCSSDLSKLCHGHWFGNNHVDVSLILCRFVSKLPVHALG